MLSIFRGFVFSKITTPNIAHTPPNFFKKWCKLVANTTWQPWLKPYWECVGSLKEYLRNLHKPKNLKELKGEIKEFWKTLTLEVCTSASLSRYIHHLHQVIPVVIDKQGSPSGFSLLHNCLCAFAPHMQFHCLTCTCNCTTCTCMWPYQGRHGECVQIKYSMCMMIKWDTCSVASLWICLPAMKMSEHPQSY